jgi:hypothetical protein
VNKKLTKINFKEVKVKKKFTLYTIISRKRIAAQTKQFTDLSKKRVSDTHHLYLLNMSDLENTIIVSCPTCYGNGGWPLYIVSVEYTLCLSISTYRVIQELKKKHRVKRNWWKVLCLVTMTLFLFFKSLFIWVPFPHRYFSDIFLCDQLPRYFLFLSFQFLALWLGGVVFKGPGRNLCCGVVVPIILLGLSASALVGLLVFSLVIAVGIFFEFCF